MPAPAGSRVVLVWLPSTPQLASVVPMAAGSVSMMLRGELHQCGTAGLTALGGEILPC